MHTLIKVCCSNGSYRVETFNRYNYTSTECMSCWSAFNLARNITALMANVGFNTIDLTER